MRIFARLHLTTEDEAAACAILETVRTEFDFTLESLAPYHKGGIMAALYIPAPDAPWPDQALAAIALAQKLAFGWHLMGEAECEIELVANERFRVSGVDWAEVQIARYFDAQ